MADQRDNVNVFYVFGDNYGVIGNATAPVNLYHTSDIHNSHIAQGNSASAEQPLTDNEKELLRLFNELGIVEQSRVIVYADALTNKQQEDTQ